MTTPEAPPRRRRFGRVRIILAALLGLITQTLVAWGIAWRHIPPSYTESTLSVRRPAGSASPVQMLYVTRSESWGRVWISTIATLSTTGWEVANHHPGPVEDIAAPWTPGDLYPPLGAPSLWPMTLAPTSAAREVALLRADGWPMASLWHRYTFDPARPMVYTQTGAITLPWLHARDPMMGTLPLIVGYLPVWQGLLVNTLVYAAAWWALLAASAAIRRWARIRRGACHACAYDLRATPPGSPCPECGRLKNA